MTQDEVIRPGEPHVILLGGGFTEPDDFVREGFVERLHARNPAAGVTLGALRMAWFADGSAATRIASHVRAARDAGAQRIWLAGISLGALGALCFAARAADEIRGLVLMSPYPGTRLVQREIDEAGGLAAWSRTAQPVDLEHEAWLWIARRRADPPRVFLYFGRGDRFVRGQRALAAALHANENCEIEGGHEWPDWGTMWDRFLQEDALR